MLPEAPHVESIGGEVVILPYLEDRSTTGLVARIRARTPGEPGSAGEADAAGSRP